jgi:hypothetical protein
VIARTSCRADLTWARRGVEGGRAHLHPTGRPASGAASTEPVPDVRVASVARIDVRSEDG